MGNRRMGLKRIEALLEAVDRDLNLANTTLTNCTITTDQACTFSGTTVYTVPSATNFSGNDADATIPITATVAHIDANGSARSGARFAGAGTAGQLLIVINSGGEKVTFDNTDATSLLRGTDSNHDTMPANFVGLFVSDGSRWNLIAGGVDTQPDVGLVAS